MEPVEWVNLRLTAIGKIVRPRLRELVGQGPRAESPAAARKSARSVYFADSKGTIECAIYDRYRLQAGWVIEGPAIVEEYDSTTVIHPGYHALVDSFGNLILKR
jgi:N-methylhydantoinase A/oxoprolinase/acetone carboxylase beta subunit